MSVSLLLLLGLLFLDPTMILLLLATFMFVVFAFARMS